MKKSTRVLAIVSYILAAFIFLLRTIFDMDGDARVFSIIVFALATLAAGFGIFRCFKTTNRKEIMLLWSLLLVGMLGIEVFRFLAIAIERGEDGTGMITVMVVAAIPWLASIAALCFQKKETVRLILWIVTGALGIMCYLLCCVGSGTLLVVFILMMHIYALAIITAIIELVNNKKAKAVEAK